MKTRRSILAASLFLGITMSAQTIGRITPRDGYVTGQFFGAPAVTLIDISHPATAAGMMTTATFRWEMGECADSVKLLFLSPNDSTSFGPLRRIVERGPFTPHEGINTVTLNPPVDVLPRDFIGLEQNGCGSIEMARGAPEAKVFQYQGRISPDIFTLGAQQDALELNLIASVQPEILARIIPVAAAAQGSFGSFFRTAVQLTNNTPTPAQGRFVYHPAGREGSSSDPSMAFTLLPFETKSYSDLVTTMGHSGLGSIDVMTTASAPPFMTVRVFDDQGDDGTSGFSEEVFHPDDALSFNDEAVLPLPADLANFRMNVGVRSLSAGASMVVRLKDKSGAVIAGPLTKNYPANFFEQTSARLFFGPNTILPPNGVITIRMSSGDAVIYGATTDNRTNDGSVRFATRD
jgi:hypothetical protein